ncbi:MAG: squalene synthase HpnD, partial [Zetaproteobacteria bacterium]
MTPQEYCLQKTRGSGSSFYYAFIFLPEDKRRAIMALYAFCREVDDIADSIQDRQVAMAKLGFWQDEVQRSFAGHPQHPVGKELSWAASRYALDEELFHEILDGMLMDINRQPVLKQADLSLYCYRVAGTVGLLSIEIFGYSNRRARAYATQLGEALQLTNILRDLGEDARLGRIYLPQEDRLRFDVRDQDFKATQANDALKQLVRHYVDRAEKQYATAIEMLPP